MAAGTGQPGSTAEPPGGRRPGRRRRVLAAVVAVVAVVAATVFGVWRPFRGSRQSGNGSAGGQQVVHGTVTRGTLTSRIPVNATLGYAGSCTVVNQAKGTYTWLPAVGRVIRQGGVAYGVSGLPVVLLYGRVPVYRPLSEGASGKDVHQLNRDLVALGYAKKAELHPSSHYFGAETATALRKLQAHLGVPQTGSLSPGRAVFVPWTARVTSVMATLSGPAAPGTPALSVSSTTRLVTASLSASEQAYVKAGDKVTVTLPGQRATPGVVTRVGTVAAAHSGTSGPSVTVEVTMSHPDAAGRLDMAPVQVLITTARVRNVLAVPVTALLAVTGGGYRVEVAGPGGRYRFVPVALGLFDDAAGLVQVTGRGLHAGQKVVEAQS